MRSTAFAASVSSTRRLSRAFAWADAKRIKVSRDLAVTGRLRFFPYSPRKTQRMSKGNSSHAQKGILQDILCFLPFVVSTASSWLKE